MPRESTSAKILKAALLERVLRFENRRDFYQYGVDYERQDSETRKRLNQIQDMGMTEVMTAEFGVAGVVSGLYIEKVWSLSTKEWDGYIAWIQSVIDKKNLVK